MARDRQKLTWWGKIAGGLAGLATGKPVLVLLGLLVGHQFDRGFARKATSRGAVHMPQLYLRTLFETLGHMAKVDGRVTEEQIRVARSIMNEFGLSPEQTRSAIDWFNAGKSAAYPLRQKLQALRGSAEPSAELSRAFVQLQLRMALADGGMNASERSLLWSVAGEFGMGRVELAQMEALARAQRGFDRSQKGRDERQRIEQAYEILGVSPSASDGEIKRAYRRLMNRHHPDKLAAQGLSDEDIASAQARTKEVRTAYESVKAKRGFK